MPGGHRLLRGYYWGRDLVTLGEIHRKRGAVPWRAVHPDGATVVDNDPMHHRQAQPGAFAHSLGREKRLEYALQDGRGHPMARIPHRQPYVGFRGETRGTRWQVGHALARVQAHG